MFDPKKFTITAPKPLPVVLLLDVSGSMSGDKINNLNKAVEDMLKAFAQEGKMETEILVSVITFGSRVELPLPYTKASQIQWQTLRADGDTPLGAALKKAKDMIEDKETTPSRAYRPTVVLVSDGQPTDSWEEPLGNFIAQGRSSKCDRMAMAIGEDADEAVLKRFIAGMPHELFQAKDAARIPEFFRLVTMSVTTRSRSQNPNEVPVPEKSQKDGGSVKPDKSGKGSKASDDGGYW
jgi:uncharacterized protein YegL